jgi:hypothetical protein
MYEVIILRIDLSKMEDRSPSGLQITTSRISPDWAFHRSAHVAALCSEITNLLLIITVCLALPGTGHMAPQLRSGRIIGVQQSETEVLLGCCRCEKSQRTLI